MSVAAEIKPDPLTDRVQLALRGIRTDVPVRRGAGAGPSDDGHVVLGGANAALPHNPDSPYVLRDGRVYEETDGDVRDLGLSLSPVGGRSSTTW